MAGCNDTRDREKIVREIEKTIESIRKKYHALKTCKIDDDIVARRRLEPILEPLQKIVDNSGTRTMKHEPDDNATSALKREDDATTALKREDDATSALKREEDKFVIRSKTNRKRAYASSPDSKRCRWNDASPPITTTPRTTIVQPTIEALPIENVFETMDDSFEESVQREVQTPEGQEALQNLHWGPLSQKYIGAILHNDKESLDIAYGVRLDNGGMMFGSKRFDVDENDNILVDGVRYRGTPGLYELIFKRLPDDTVYTNKDLQTYKSLLLVTNAHRRDHDAQSQLKGSTGHKYKYVIAPLLSIKPKKSYGKGLLRAMTVNDNAIDCMHWDDPNELVDRLRLLVASRQAGHNGHDNEILSIIEELREAGLIIN